MGIVKQVPPVCSLSQHCSQWVRTYLKYFLCNAKDGVSLALGVVSVISWGVAEIPQIITNYREKSTEGLSVAFLMTWIVGDLFNVIGCLLEPATLPTQYYMALLYTATTMILTAQTVYYGHIYHRLKENRKRLMHKSNEVQQEHTLTNENLIGYNTNSMESEAGGHRTDGFNSTMASSPIPVAESLDGSRNSSGRDLHYISARSLSKSPIPATVSRLAHSGDPGRTPPTVHILESSKQPLLGGVVPTDSSPPSNIKNTLCVVSFASTFLGLYAIHLSVNNSSRASPPGMVVMVGRKLLQDKAVDLIFQEGGASSAIGSFLGWAMTAIYLGGRLPQICLNNRRGNVKGLNPLMFIFALFGNLTYLGSILVSSLEWSKIRPNLPWLVDAGGCALLDGFILIQFIYFHYWKPKDPKDSERTDHYILV